jgi:hypothetical protein
MAQIAQSQRAPALRLALPIGWLSYFYWHGRKQARRHALGAALETVARQGRGTVDGDVDAYVAWLNRHWAGAYTIPYASLGSWFYSVRLKVGPYAGLAEINLEPPDLASPRINLLLAAWIPGVSDADDGARAGKAQALSRSLPGDLRALGCFVGGHRGGLDRAHGSRSGPPGAVRARPESTTAVMGIFAQLSRHAVQLGAI